MELSPITPEEEPELARGEVFLFGKQATFLHLLGWYVTDAPFFSNPLGGAGAHKKGVVTLLR